MTPVRCSNSLAQSSISKPLALSHLRVVGFPFSRQDQNIMSLLTDFQIINLSRDVGEGKNIHGTPVMIAPFREEAVTKLQAAAQILNVPSFGITSYGYDFTIGRNFKLPRTANDGYNVKYIDENGELKQKWINSLRTVRNLSDLFESEYDPSDDEDDLFVEFKNVQRILIPARSFFLGATGEHFNIPRNMIGQCLGKSTLARHATSIFVTPLEPGWSGFLTLEYVNNLDVDVWITAGQGGGQIQFFSSGDCKTSYADRKGKYQNQPAEPVTSKMFQG